MPMTFKFKLGDVVRVVVKPKCNVYYGVVVGLPYPWAFEPGCENRAARCYRVRTDTANFRRFTEIGCFEDEMETEPK